MIFFAWVGNIDSRETEVTLVEMLFHLSFGLVSNNVNKNRTRIQSRLLIYTRSSGP